jgi:hypothetical protein
MLILTVLLFPVTPAHAQKGKPKPPPPPPVVPRYTVEWVAPRPNQVDENGNVIVAPKVTITGVNKYGDVVGNQDSFFSAFAWLSNEDGTGGAFFPKQNYFSEEDKWYFSRIDAINNHRQVVGVFYHNEEREVDGEITLWSVPRYLRVDLTTAGTYEEILEMDSARYVKDMNDHGDLCGFRYDSQTTRSTPFVILGGTAIEQYPFPPELSMRSEKINNAGQIIGQMGSSAYRLTPSADLNYEAGTSLVTVSSVGPTKRNMYLAADAFTLTENGSFGGWAATSSGTAVAYRYTDADGAVALTSANNSQVRAMNDEGDIVYSEVSGTDVFWKVVDGDTGETIDLSAPGAVVLREGQVPPDFIDTNLLYAASFKGVSRDGVICGQCRNYLIFLRPIRN